MELIRHLAIGAILCGACCNAAEGQHIDWIAPQPLAPQSLAPQPLAPRSVGAPAVGEPLFDRPVVTAPVGGEPRLARLPAITPPGMPGGNAFTEWYRSDLKLAPDDLDHNSWGSGKAIKLAPWRLLPPLSDGWSLTGFMDIGATANPDQPANRFNGPVTFNDRNDLQLNQLYLTLQRAPDNPGDGLSWGSRVDLLFGTDYIFVQSDGLETKPGGDNALNGVTAANGAPALYGLAIPQAYVDLACNRFRVRLGHFYSIAGYEGVAATSNFFHSHAYALQYGEPLTHSGGLVSWTGDQMTVQAGVVNQWNTTNGINDEATFLGGIAFAGRNSSLGITAISGQADGFTTSGQRSMYSVVWQTAISDRLAYVLQHDLAYQENALAANDDATWYGITQYLFLALNDQWRLGMRYEWFRDADGARLASMYVRNGGLGLPAAGFAGAYHNATFGANWVPNANLTVRPEVRWDWSADTGVAPFADFTSDSQFTIAIDAIYIF